IGRPENIPWYLPMGNHIRAIHFSGRIKQCSKCYMFGHFHTACENRAKSPSEYRRWLFRRINRKDKEGNSLPITSNFEDVKERNKNSRETAESSEIAKEEPIKQHEKEDNGVIIQEEIVKSTNTLVKESKTQETTVEDEAISENVEKDINVHRKE
ncbi:Uncharacterized protein FKW44_010855, partial [Caligus rogercresseyi]